MSVCCCFDIYLFAFQNISKPPLDKNNNSIRTKTNNIIKRNPAQPKSYDQF